MKLTPTSIANRSGNGGFATALEFKRAILAESESVVRKVAAMTPEKYRTLPITITLAIKMHRDRVAKYTREIAEIEARGEPNPSANSIDGDTSIEQEPPPPAAANGGRSNVDVNPSGINQPAAAGFDQDSDSPLGTQSYRARAESAASPSEIIGDKRESSEGQPVNPAVQSGGARDTNTGSGTNRGTTGDTLGNVEKARELLGVWQAVQMIPLWCPEGWTRRPELARAKPFARNRQWRYGADKGDIIELVRIVYDDLNGYVAADRIIEMVSEMPADLQEFCLPANPEPKQEKGDTAEYAALPEIEDAADFLARDVPVPLELVKGILHQGSKMIFAGGSKSFKTWSLLDLAVSIAYGRDWLGFPTQQGAALYINLEIGEAFFGRRIHTVAEAKSISIEHGRLSVMNLRGHAADLSKLLPQLLVSISERKYALIVLDPIYKVLGGRDENDAGHIAGLLNELERLAVETDAAVVFAAHYSKGGQAGKASIDRMSGSGVFARDPDTILALTQHEEVDAFTVEATLRNHPPVAPFVVRWEYPLMKRDGDLNPSKLKQVSGRPKAHTADDLLKALGDQELSFSAWKAAALKDGISETTFKALRKELVAAGQVYKCEENETYRKGRKGENAD